MATLTPESVKKFKEIYKSEYGKEISDQEAWESAHNLVNFFELLMTVDNRQKNKEKEE